MNKKAVKRPFVLRTIIAMICIFLLISAFVTYLYAQEYMHETDDDISVLMETLASDISYCRDINRESVEYRDGLNVAQAYAIVRQCRFMGLKKFNEKDVAIDVGLYHVEKDKASNDEGFTETIPQTTTVFDAPFSARSSIIVLEDAFNDESIKKIEAVIDAGVFSSYIEGAKGYKEGRFFYPTEINIGTYEGKDIIVKATQKGREGDIVNKNLQDIQIVRSDGTIMGGHVSEINKTSDFRKKHEQEELDKLDENGGTMYQDSSEMTCDSFILKEAETVHSKTFRGTGYVLKAYAHMRPVSYAVKSLADFYVGLFAILLLITFIFITALNNAVEHRFETEEKRRHMMDSMAHEMKTPLSVIKNYSEVLIEETDKEKRDYYTESIIDEADRMNQAVISMLDFSKMEAGTYPMELSSVSVSKLAVEQAARSKILADRKNLKLETKIQDNIRIFADERLVNSIISNFISNGIGHAAAEGIIRLVVESKGKEIYIAVYNQGNQIPEKDMERLWETFFSNRSANPASTGVGLAIVRNACLMHNGTYGCKNEKDGVTFWVKIKPMENIGFINDCMAGPVIGVTGEVYNLTGMILIAFGALLQSIPAFRHLGGALLQLSFCADDYTFHSGVYSPWLILIGVTISGFGVYRLCRNDLMDKKWFSAVAVMAAGITAMQIPGETITHTEAAVLIAILLVIWIIVIAAVSLRCFDICMDIAMKKQLMAKYGKLRFNRNLYIFLYVLYVIASIWMWILAHFDYISTISLYFTYVMGAVIPVYAMICYIRAWLWFNGRWKKL